MNLEGLVSTFEILPKTGETVPIEFFDGNSQEYQSFQSISEFLTHLVGLQGTAKRKDKLLIFSHSPENIPLRTILNHMLTKTRYKVRFPEGVFHIEWLDTNINFLNAYHLLPLSLSNAVKAFGISSTSPQTCILLSEAVTNWLAKLYKEFSIKPYSSTLSIAAVKAFDKSYYPLKRIRGNEDFGKSIRAATYGMRNEIYRKFGEDIYFYDIHDMFTSCYDVPIPIGQMHWATPRIDRGTIAEAKVKVPLTSYLGPLPYILDGKLTFPVGEFQSWWDMRELRNAVNKGTDVILLQQLECDEEPILDEFGKHVCDLRAESNKTLGKLWKQFGIQLSQKFGQKKKRGIVKPVSEMTEGEWDFSVPIIESDERYYSVPITSGHSPYKKPAINMRVRAEARIRHLDYLLQAHEKGKLYYCDTDSVVCNCDMETVEEPGKLGYVDYAKKAYFIKQKFYGYVRPDGHIVQRTAGHSGRNLTEENFQTLLSFGEVAMHDYRSCSWRDLFQTDSIHKIELISLVSGKEIPKNRIPEGDIETVPIVLPRQSVPKAFEEALQ